MGESCIPRVGVGVLLVDELNRVLLTLRNRPPEAGCWSIVGGKLDFLETLEECAAREAREEVGVEVSIQSLLCVTDHCLPQENQHWVPPRISRKYGPARHSTVSRRRPLTSSGSNWIACLPI